jgi:hypothetical protein
MGHGKLLRVTMSLAPCMAWACTAMACSVLACTRPAPSTPASVPPASVVANVPPAAGKGSIERGTELLVELRDPLDDRTSKPGDPFVARTLVALRDGDGEIVVPRDAVVRGHVVSAGGTPTPKLEIAFDTVETRDGPVRISARLVDAENFAVVGSPLAREESLLLPPIGPGAGIGGGPVDTTTGKSAWRAGDNAQSPTYHVSVPTGAQLRLILVQPLSRPR